MINALVQVRLHLQAGSHTRQRWLGTGGWRLGLEAGGLLGCGWAVAGLWQGCGKVVVGLWLGCG